MTSCHLDTPALFKTNKQTKIVVACAKENKLSQKRKITSFSNVFAEWQKWFKELWNTVTCCFGIFHLVNSFLWLWIDIQIKTRAENCCRRNLAHFFLWCEDGIAFLEYSRIYILNTPEFCQSNAPQISNSKVTFGEKVANLSVLRMKFLSAHRGLCCGYGLLLPEIFQHAINFSLGTIVTDHLTSISQRMMHFKTKSSLKTLGSIFPIKKHWPKIAQIINFTYPHFRPYKRDINIPP